MDAVVSGHAGVALLLDGNKLSSLHFGEDEIVPRRPSDVPLLLSGAEDLRMLRNVRLEQVRKQLDLESTRIDALHLSLILLDGDLSEETRRTAAQELDEMLLNEALAAWLERVLYAHPLPPSADLARAYAACTRQTRRTRSFLQELELSQDEIAEVHGAWLGIPTHVFGSERDKTNALVRFVREGVFRELVKRRAGDRICANPPTDEELEAFLRGESRGRGASNARIVRHLLAGCRSCQHRLEGLRHRFQNYDYGASFAAAEQALSSFFAEEAPAEHAAEELLRKLSFLPADEQARKVSTESRFAHPSFVRHAISASQAVRYQDTAKSFDTAHLACLVAERCTVEAVGSGARLVDLRAAAWGQYGNVLRVQGRLREAEAALVKAERYLEEGTRDPLSRARLSTQIASLRTVQRRFDEAIELADKAILIYRELDKTDLQASAMVQKAVALLYAGEAEDAIHILSQAIPLIDEEGDPHLLLAACHNLIRGYIDLERPEQAMSLYFEARDLYMRFDDPLVLLRVAWQEGQLLRDLGHLTAAESTLLRARQGFVERNDLYEVALISLDLAAIYVKRRDGKELANIVAETVPIFRSLGVQREMLTLLLQLKRLVGEEERALELIGSLNSIFGLTALRPGSYR